jgi:hypothetical protein
VLKPYHSNIFHSFDFKTNTITGVSFFDRLTFTLFEKLPKNNRTS